MSVHPRVRLCHISTLRLPQSASRRVSAGVWLSRLRLPAESAGLASLGASAVWLPSRRVGGCLASPISGFPSRRVGGFWLPSRRVGGCLASPLRSKNSTRSSCKSYEATTGITGSLATSTVSRNSGRERGRIWRRKLSRRRRDGDVTWAQFLRLEKYYSLPRARVVHGLQSHVAKS